ncbi:hypothetical protein I5M32_10320 [Pedobacter sp. SD-b]|uniref:SnoaL-like domain-containing protein n=1 Tax=Pedobacter segetis TaxID=2793069 RepID=A0ABS1BKD3_9SPHI|nr:hypothetical protein [Pedobacter segetis]MBK0383355.1 hypothetical protein [Pedobacter segetis]
MDTATLVNLDIEQGKQLVQFLDSKQFNIESAFWYFMEEPEVWRLIIASEEVDINGPKKTYRKILDYLKEKPEIEIPLQAISVISISDTLNKTFKSFVKTGDEISGIRLSRNVINGVFIKDAYIYRVN